MTSPQTFYEALAGMDDGFFPLGVNGFPHGGIHMNNSVGMFGTKDGVRCIADGYIVAYKIDDAYPHLQFKDGKWAMYSTGFVLVRHTLTLPPAPNSTGAQPADESHDIYSLYMHTADWVTYLADDKLQRPWWWLNVDAFRVQDRDHQMAPPKDGTTGAAGAFVWTEPKAGKKAGSFTAGEQVGFLPEGSEVITSETRGQWVHIKSITAGHMVSPVNGGYFGEADQNVPWKAEADNAKVTPENDWGWLYKPNLKGIKEPDPVGQVVIPPTPVFVKAGTPLGQIGEYHDYERATPLPPVPKRQLLHLEVFADDGFSAFLDKSRARAAQFLLPDQLPLLVIHAGAKLVKDVLPADRKLCEWHPLYRADVTPDSPASGPWIKVQPRYQDSSTTLLMSEGSPVWIEREKLATATATTPAWSRFPLSVQKVADPANAFTLVYSRSQLDGLDARDKAVDDGKTQWWRVEFGNADGHPASGWVCEKNHPNTQWQSPWAWPGFESVDATGINLTDAFRRNLVLTGSADWKERKEFEPSVMAVNGSPLLLKLEQTIAKLAPPPRYGASTKPKENPAGKVTAKAMQAAMRTPWLAQALSHVMLRYESEWGGDMSRWNAITPLMRNAKDNWLVELQRIHKLQWWNDVKGKVAGFPVSATVLHIHPIALIGLFDIVRKRRDYDLGKLSSQYETGGRGPSTISGGQGDPGGISYGSYQMTSKTRQLDGSFVVGGTVQKFVTSPDFPWGIEFAGLTPGTPAFSEKWRSVVAANTAKFKDIEHEFIRKTHFDVQIKTVKSRAGVDLRYHSHAINDVVWSVSVQNGPQSDVIGAAIENIGGTPAETRAYDVTLIDAIYAERGKKNSHGQLIRFINSSAQVKHGIEGRYTSERQQAQEELKNESDY